MSFYYRCKDRLFSIKETDLNMVLAFKKIYEKNERIHSHVSNACTILDPFDTAIAVFIDQYISLWSGKEYDYINEEIINNGKPEIILHDNDLMLIRGFIEYSISLNDQYASYNSLYKKKYIVKSIYNIIEACGKIELKSLLKKLYIYIADIVWNCSIEEVLLVEEELNKTQVKAEVELLDT